MSCKKIGNNYKLTCLEDYSDGNGTVLMLGSLTPKDGQEKKMYYSSPNNYFYKILDCLYNTEEFSKKKNELLNLYNKKDIKRLSDEMKDLLNKKGIVCFDVIKSCLSIGGSASDEDLKDIKLNSSKAITKILDKNPNIKTICTNSEYVNKCFYKLMLEKHFEEKLARGDRKIVNDKLSEKGIKIIKLYSPSQHAINRLKNKEIDAAKLWKEKGYPVK